MLPAAFSFFHFHFSTDLDLSHTGRIDGKQFVFVCDDTAGREIRPFDVFHHLFRIDIRIFHVRDHTVDHFAKVMWRDVRCHTDRDPFRAVDQNVRDFDREHFRLFLRLVKVWYKIDHILVEIGQIDILGQFLQARFRITHGCGSVSLDRAKVSMPVNKRHPFFKILCHNDQRFINGAVSMRMVFTHGISDNTRALTVRLVVADTQLIHIIKRPALYRF